MSSGIRRKVGVALVAASIVSAIIVFAATGKSGYPQVVSQKDAGTFHETVVIVPVTVHDRWLAPSFTLFVIGLAFLAWPSRKPPRLIS